VLIEAGTETVLLAPSVATLLWPVVIPANDSPDPSDVLEVAIEVTLVQLPFPIPVVADALVATSPHPFCPTSETVAVLVVIGFVPV
jgi:hypothetical protein